MIVSLEVLFNCFKFLIDKKTRSAFENKYREKAYWRFEMVIQGCVRVNGLESCK